MRQCRNNAVNNEFNSSTETQTVSFIKDSTEMKFAPFLMVHNQTTRPRFNDWFVDSNGSTEQPYPTTKRFNVVFNI